MKKTVITLIVLWVSVFCLFATGTTTPEVMKASKGVVFTFSESSVSGFSKKKIIDASAIPDNLKYVSGEMITCKFNPDTNTYDSEVFYAYVQAFTTTGLTMTLSAPNVMTCTKTGDGSTIPYTFVDLPGALAWQEVNGVKSVSTSDPAGDLSARLLYCQPIQVSVNSKDVPFGKTFNMSLTLVVSSNA